MWHSRLCRQLYCSSVHERMHNQLTTWEQGTSFTTISDECQQHLSSKTNCAINDKIEMALRMLFGSTPHD
jgi:hypothetical protein